MPRRARCLALLAAGAVGAASVARAQATAELPVRALARGVYAVLGDSGRGMEGRANAGFVVTDSGVLVIDALGTPREGEALLRAIRSVTPQKVRWLVITHHHPDHEFVAAPLLAAGARLIAHPDRGTLAADQGDAALVAEWTAAHGADAMRGFVPPRAPDLAIRADTSLYLGGRSIGIMRGGGAHTPGDLLVWVADDGVIFAGDLLVEDGLTMVVDGSSGALLGALNLISALGPTTIVPGHGRIPADPFALLALTRCEALRQRATLGTAARAGQPLSRVLAELPKPDRDHPLSRASRIQRNAVRIYAEMERASAAGEQPTDTGSVGRCR